MKKPFFKIVVIGAGSAVLVAVITVGLLRPRQTRQVSQLPDTAPMFNADQRDANGPTLEQARYDSKMPGPASMASQAAQPGEFSAEQQQRAIRDYYLAEDGVALRLRAIRYHKGPVRRYRHLPSSMADAFSSPIYKWAPRLQRLTLLRPSNPVPSLSCTHPKDRAETRRYRGTKKTQKTP